MQLGVVFVIKVIFVAQDKFDDTREVCLFFFFFAQGYPFCTYVSFVTRGFHEHFL